MVTAVVGVETWYQPILWHLLYRDIFTFMIIGKLDTHVCSHSQFFNTSFGFQPVPSLWLCQWASTMSWSKLKVHCFHMCVFTLNHSVFFSITEVTAVTRWNTTAFTKLSCLSFLLSSSLFCLLPGSCSLLPTFWSCSPGSSTSWWGRPLQMSRWASGDFSVLHQTLNVLLFIRICIYLSV